MNTSSRRRAKSAFRAAALLLLSLPSVQAATTHTLTATGANNWSVPANWSGGAPTSASAGDTAQYFVGSTASVTTLDVSGVKIGFLTQASSGQWTITSATNALTLDNGASGAAITNAFSSFNGSVFTIDVNLSLNSNLSLVSGNNASHLSGITLGSSAGGRAITGSQNITLTSGNAPITLNDNVSVAGSLSDTFTTTVTNTVAGIIGSSVTGVTLNSVSGHALLLSNLNTYTGATTISLGTLTAGIGQSGAAGAFGNNSAVSLANAAGATLNLAGFNESLGSLTGGGTTGGNVTLGAGTLTVGSDNASPAAYAGVISGTGGLTKIGNGTLTLSGANTYTGSTTLSAGEVRLDNTGGSATGTGAVSETGGVLSGAGAAAGLLIVTGTVTSPKTNSAVIAPGDNPAGTTQGKAGTLSVGTSATGATAGATLTSAELDFDLSASATAILGSNDQIVTGGTPSLGTLAFKFYETGGLDTTNTYTIISSAGAPTLQSGATLAGYAAATTISGPGAGAYTPTFHLTSNGLTVHFDAAPEPGQTSTMSLIGLGMVGLFLRARKRRVNSEDNFRQKLA